MIRMQEETVQSATVEKLRTVYTYFQSIPGLIGTECTFTFAPGRCTDIQLTKKRCISTVSKRIDKSKDIAGYILTRENHESGWPHVHGIVWYPKDNNNAMTLSGGRIWKAEKNPVTKKVDKGWLFNELGTVRLDPLRTEPYIQQPKDASLKPKEFNSWFDYIIKDQDIKWKVPNIYKINEVNIEWFFEKLTEETDFIE